MLNSNKHLLLTFNHYNNVETIILLKLKYHVNYNSHKLKHLNKNYLTLMIFI